MSGQINDGGPAFPQAPFVNPQGDVTLGGAYFAEAVGMSLRAYFAGQALAGLNANPHDSVINADSERRARWAVNDADALIAELNKPKEAP